MKLLRLPILLFAFALIIIGCKKKDSNPANYFSFNGTTYEIVGAYQGGNLLAHQLLDTTIIYHVHQLLFTGVAGKDSAILVIALADESNTSLTGNYTSLPLYSSASRGIIPKGVDSTFYSIANSGIILNSNVEYLTGQGGSMDISLTGINYTISFNSISAGLYTNLGAQYDEKSKINGRYTGPLQLATISSTQGNSKIAAKNIVSYSFMIN